MSEPHPGDPGHREAEERRRLVRYSLWASGALLLAAIALYAVFWLPYREPAKKTPWIVQTLPPAPAPARPADEAALQESGWVDREAGVVSIPVEEAMAILAGRLPVREDGMEAGAERAREQPPTDAGSGRAPRPDR